MDSKYLAGALANYSKRSGGKVIFCNGLSLNKLALAMWERAPSCGIDASILSKVLNGKRAFTPYQLQVFCNVLSIDQTGKEYLFYCLHKDQCLRQGVEVAAPFIASAGTYAFVEGLLCRAERLFDTGKWRDLYDLSDMLRVYLQEHAATVYGYDPDNPLIATYQRVVYLYAKSAIVTSSQGTIVRKLGEVIQTFRHYPTSTSVYLVPGYAASFKAAAYRVLGVFPSPRNVAFDAESAALCERYAAEAIAILPPTHLEYFCALRNAIDSAIDLGEREVFLGYVKIAKQAMFRPGAHPLGCLHVASTIGKGMARFKIGDPFALKLQTERHYGRTFEGAKFLELSDLKTELEIYVTLKSKRDQHIEQKIRRALTLANEESARYKPIITHLAEQL